LFSTFFLHETWWVSLKFLKCNNSRHDSSDQKRLYRVTINDSFVFKILFLLCRHFLKALNSCCQLVQLLKTWWVYGSFHILIVFVRLILWAIERFENEWIIYSNISFSLYWPTYQRVIFTLSKLHILYLLSARIPTQIISGRKLKRLH
jgi:hypothetical protein